ncbi:MAG: PD-(D/E)XK nuclease family protein [Candidatus Accumulibacter sp.]|jgi:ATP-dependent helicase/nuclease subunit B|nr:PD-(D/E)XK nuclease family protein [Accumulibacter sp.]
MENTHLCPAEISAQSLSGRAFALVADEKFFDRLAGLLFETYPAKIAEADLSDILVLTPALPIGAEFRSVLARAAPAPLLLPRFDTLKNWAFRKPFHKLPAPCPASERLVLLYEALRARNWLNEAARWGIASEMSALFEELSARAIRLPEGKNAFIGQLEKAYALKALSPLEFEATLIHELWSVLNKSGIFDKTTVYHMRLAEIARSAEHTPQPLFVLLDAAPEEALNPVERDFLRRYGEFQPLHLFYPALREARATPLMRTLEAAWPQISEKPLHERAMALSREIPRSPLENRLRIIQTNGIENEARTAVAQIGVWLNEGMRRIALIAQDRLTARRARALLERQNVLVKDETGWKLSTSRAAATIDALLETVAGNAYYRDLLDLCKSPYVFSDIATHERQTAIFALETAIRRASLSGELYRVRRCLSKTALREETQAIALIDHVTSAADALSGPPVRLTEWLNRLRKALEILGALVPLEGDSAGKTLLKLLEERQSELDSNKAAFSFSAWRAWFNREMDEVNFRDDRIESPIVLTPLNAVCLRRFDAALLLGGNAHHLSPAASERFFNQSARRELGLKTRTDEERKLRRDIELLLAIVPRVVVTWQSRQNEESCQLAPDLALLSELHRLAWNDDLSASSSPFYPESEPDVSVLPGKTVRPAPVILPALIPNRISAGAYATLAACPYRFFARYALGLGEMDEVREQTKKQDYGRLIHRVLEVFHSRHPLISALEESEALAALSACVDEIFDPLIAEDFLAVAWKIRWGKRLNAYLDWQRTQEKEGWRWTLPEMNVSRALTLDHGKRLELHGRIDRVDYRVSHENSGVDIALLDYKTRKTPDIKKTLGDDVQLPVYALMFEENAGASHGFPKEAAYIALDDEKISAQKAGGGDLSLRALADAQEERLRRIFNALLAGGKMPAHGASHVCVFCEMNGLCRKDHA